MTVSTAARSRATLGAALALLVLLLAAFWPVVVGRRSFFHMDLYYEHLPVWAATQRALRAGESPFWLDGEYCGHPPLFHQEAPLFYPATVPLLLTGAPVHRLADLFTLGHYWLAGFAVFLLVREWTDRPAAALLGGMAWMLSARMVQSALWPNAVAVSALVPLGLYGLCLIARGRRRGGVLWAAIPGGLALLAARPHVLLASSPIVLAVAVALVWTSARRRRVLGDFLLAAGLALALGAPSVVPTAALLPETSRSAGVPADAADFQPLAQGRELDMVFLPVDGRRRWPESAAYPGAAVYLLFAAGIAFAAARNPRFPRAPFFALAAGGVAGLVLAFGQAGPYRFLTRLPLVRGFRVPERFLLSWSLALAVGAALGLAGWLARSRRPRLLAGVCLIGLAGDLVWHARSASPTAEAAVYRVEPAVLEPLRRRLGVDEVGFPRRYFAVAETIYPVPFSDADRPDMLRRLEAVKWGLGMRFGLESAGGYGPTLARTEELLSGLTPQAARMAGIAAIVASTESSVGDSLRSPPPLRILDVPALPRAVLVPEAIVVSPADALRVAVSPPFDPRRAVVFESGAALAASPAWTDAEASVRLLARRPDRMALDVRLPSAGALVLFDSYEKGWRASVDGKPVDVQRADGAFRGIRVPPGPHRVEFTYSPPGLREGLLLGAAGVLGTILAARRLRPV